jgi:hypothetical protein
VGEEVKAFFFEKKNQKTFGNLAEPLRKGRSQDAKVFWFFFSKKNILPSLPLFLVSLGAVGYEIALTRYFAVATWSEYGYWVISIVLAGFAFSGVALAVAQDLFTRRSAQLLAVLPPILVLAAAGGYWAATVNPFNPLQLQNAATHWAQLGNIALYYAAFLPFYTLAGLFIGLCFMAEPGRIGRVYGTDLIGAGTGALLVLLLMRIVPPFRLVACLLLPLAAAGAFPRPRAPLLLASLAALAFGEWLLLAHDQARINDFKAIYAPLHVAGSRTIAALPRPAGLYMLLDDFTERLDADVSNNATALGVPDPPRALGFYRDGNRIAALPKTRIDAAYAPAALAALPYALLTHPRVLLAGASGGFRLAEAAALGAASIVASEPEPMLLRQILAGPALPAGTRLTQAPPLALTGPGAHYELVDIAGDFADSAEANATSFSVEALAADLRSVRPAGLVSIPVSIREFPAYATRMLVTARAALLAAGIADPARHAIVYRSAWNVRILLSPAPFTPQQIAAARAWCDARSFDPSYYPGMDLAASRAGIYNDLPAVSFESAEVTSGEGLHDAVADEAGVVLAGQTPASARSFDLAPITLDRPALNAVLRLSRLDTILARLEILPQGEVGPVVNLAVLAQAVVIALLVLAVPLAAGARLRAGTGLARACVFFPALGLGFLMIEIAAIEAASLLLTDRTLAFALVLTSMLIFSGIGAMASQRLAPTLALRTAAGAVLLWCALMLAILPGALVAALPFGFAARVTLVVLAVAPVSFALGMPFPLGLARLGAGGALPWAWGLNGAFSVAATPLANLIATEAGHAWLLYAAMILYSGAIVAFPKCHPRCVHTS